MNARLITFAAILTGVVYNIFADDNVSALIKTVGSSPAAFDSAHSEVADKVPDVLDFVISVCTDRDYHSSGCWVNDDPGVVPEFATDFPMELTPRHRPVGGCVTSKVGYRSRWHRLHLGLDFAAEIGDTVIAAVDGVVDKIGFDKTGYGLFLIIKNKEGLESRYGHLSKVLVAENETVVDGAPIALCGNSGNSTGPHLHFELRYHGRIVDPAMFFK